MGGHVRGENKLRPPEAWTLTDEQKKLAADNYNLIQGWINRYAKHVKDRESLVCYLHEHLCRAAKGYKPKLGKFSTYAYKCFWFGFLKYFHELRNNINYNDNHLNEQLDHWDELEVDQDWGRYEAILKRYWRCRLLERNINIMKKRFWGGMTLRAIGREEGLERERIRQITEAALRVLREHVRR